MNSPSGVECAGVADEPRRRRGIPKWLWISGSVGLGILVVIVVGVVLLVGSVKRMFDPGVQWPAIREVIQVDEPPPPYDVIGVPRLGAMTMKGWALSEPAGHRFAMLFHVSGDRANGMRESMLASKDGELLGEVFDPAVPVEAGTIVVQGRELRCMRARVLGRTDHTESKKDRSGPAILIDLSREDSDEFLGWMMVLEGQSGRVEDAAAVEFLRPFHVGPDR